MNHGPTISIYDADPDGHKNELQIDTMPMELANDRLLSPEFIANPVGWPFDPDELVASYEAGTPLIELMTVGREQYFRELAAANWLRTAIGRPGARLGDLAGVGSDWALRGLTFASLLESGVRSA